MAVVEDDDRREVSCLSHMLERRRFSAMASSWRRRSSAKRSSIERGVELGSGGVESALSCLGACLVRRRRSAISAEAPSAEKKPASSYANERKIPDAKRAP